MANSGTVCATDGVVYTQYNNLRKDVVDASTGHNHSGSADCGKKLPAGCFSGMSATVSLDSPSTNVTYQNTKAFPELRIWNVEFDMSGQHLYILLGASSPPAWTISHIFNNGGGDIQIQSTFVVPPGSYWMGSVSVLAPVPDQCIVVVLGSP